MDSICVQCGKQFSRNRCKIIRSKRHFCSRDCLHIGQRHEGNPNWRGAKSPQTAVKNGYQRITVNGKHTLYHRYLMEQELGRSLNPTEIVHHLDGNPLNNSSENLWLTDPLTHRRFHRRAVNIPCAYCGKELSRKPSHLQRTIHSFCNIGERNTFYSRQFQSTR